MDNVVLVYTGSEGIISTSGNNFVVKLVDIKNAPLAEYVFYRKKLKNVSTFHYKADNIHVHFYYYNEAHERIVIKPSEIMEIVSSFL